MYRLLGGDGHFYESKQRGSLGGNRRLKIYGRLDCPSANRHLRRGHYKKWRVFFASEAEAIGVGYRPCGVCMKDKYIEWKEKCVVPKKIKNAKPSLGAY